jgi:uncharacterized membrane protein
MASPGEEWLEDKTNIDRMIFFSDAVFAIAITLLILQVQIPKAPPSGLKLSQLLDLIPKFTSYVISFLVIARFWLKHLLFSSYIKRLDQRLIWLNALLLLLIAFLPYPTGVYGAYSTSPIAVAFYALSIALTGYMYSMLWLYAVKNRAFVKEEASDKELIKSFRLSLVIPTGFLVSVGLAFINTNIALVLWIVLLVAFRFVRKI